MGNCESCGVEDQLFEVNGGNYCSDCQLEAEADQMENDCFSSYQD